MKLPNQKGFAPILVVSVIIVLAIGAVFILRNQASNTRSFPTPTSPNNKIYWNSKYGFQFEYDKNSEIISEDGKGVTIDYPKDAKSITDGKFRMELVSKCKDYIQVQGMDISGQVTINGKSIQIYEVKSNKGSPQYNTAACLENNGDVFLLTNLYGPNVYAYSSKTGELITSSKAEELITRDRQFFSQILNSFKFVSPGGRTDQTYTSNNLGVSFLYSPITSSGQRVIVKEVGNKVYAYIEGQDMNNANYIEVINIENNNNVIDSMNQYILQHFTKDDCFDVYNVQGKYPEGKKWEVACPLPETGSSSHSDYFLYDKNNSKKFIFVNIQFIDKVLTSDYERWYTTLNFQQ